nr:unnamed protein product [Digitaria exilis]
MQIVGGALATAGSRLGSTGCAGGPRGSAQELASEPRTKRVKGRSYSFLRRGDPCSRRHSFHAATRAAAEGRPCSCHHRHVGAHAAA